jgi:hypothetical protein
VDDILISSSSIKQITFIKQQIAKQCEIDDLGEVSYYLGINISRNFQNKTMTISQSSYIKKLLEKYKIKCNKKVSTTLPTNFQYDKEEINALSPEKLQYVENFPTRQILGALNYIALCTRPDISFSVSLLARYQDKPNASTCNAITHLLKYLYSTIDKHITYSGKKNILVGYSDADWAGDKDSRKSTSGYVFYLCNCPISWGSKLQPTIALSSTESEYIALTIASQEAIWLRSLFIEWSLNMITPTTIWCDNNSAIQLCHNHIYHNKTKHIQVKFHFIRSLIQEHQILVDKIHTTEMLADLLTKNVTATVNENLMDKLLGSTTIQQSNKRQRIIQLVKQQIKLQEQRKVKQTVRKEIE